MGKRLRGSLPIAVVTLLYLVTLGGTFYTLDVAYYQQEKWQLITARAATRYEGYVDADAERLLYAAFTAWVESGRSASPRPGTREALLDAAGNRAQQVLALSPAVTRVTLEDRDGEPLREYADPERLKRLNTFRNSLFDRRFERSVQRQFSLSGRDELAGRYRLFLTSGSNDPELERLTASYWRRVGFFFVLLTSIYGALVRWALVPLRRVNIYMQSRNDGPVPIINSPSSALEKSYNDLARDAALTRYSKELRDLISSGGYSYAEPILEAAPALYGKTIGFGRCELHIFGRKSTESPWKLERVFGQAEGEAGDALQGVLLEIVIGLAPEQQPKPRQIHWTPPGRRGRSSFVDVLHLSTETCWLFLIHPPQEQPIGGWWIDFLSRIAQELRYALTSIEEQRRLILQEKSKANISLSRNLGHDLTNIIATSKLELMTVRTFLSLPPAEISSNPRKEALFRESLEALLNNTRFLQEIVNLYRSFSFLQKPKFEEINISELVADTVQLYRPSLSRDFEFDLKLAEDLPPITVEPRLLRLALFNLLTNATEAIRRSATDDKPKGRMTLKTRMSSDRAHLEISVDDSGPGIRDAAGNLMTEDSLSEIFRLGFSTKKNQEGEGLGLNWVQSIVREFHGGEILARNLDGGGARFIIRLPLDPPEVRTASGSTPRLTKPGETIQS